ncbi:MAG TPA: helix-turn-helix domain-containing protein [Candidatus Latescibacteria bacterium]|nr:helix-turn-helix domain-containing protein [Candidatus Handelsmanbacteria bacterium]HIL07111.1 helix-turn-helix domain-containing protein [Candidatus Latescibacterota bacterium]
MPNLVAVLSDEIRRLSRKEVRIACEPLQSQVRDLKKVMRKQRDTIARLEQQISQLKAVSAKPADKIIAADNIGTTRQIRLSPSSIKKHRKRLKISQSELSRLLNVSTNTVVRWEAGTSIPRDTYRPGLAQLRTMGIKEVKTLLR